MRPKAPKFWMVYGDGQRGSTFKHPTKKQATEEASRLARLNPGTPFFVLSVVGGFLAEEPKPQPLEIVFRQPDEDDDIPF